MNDVPILVGGGSRSRLWIQIFADIYNIDIVKTNIGEDAGSLGAAAVAAVGSGMWKDFTKIDDVHRVSDITRPLAGNTKKYRSILPAYKYLRETQAKTGEMLNSVNL